MSTSCTGKQARFQRVGHHKGPKTPSDDQTTSSISFKTTGNISVATMSTDEQRRTSRSDVGHQVAPWRRRESSSPPTERIPMVEEAPWRKRSRSEDRRPGQLPVKKNEPAWKQGLQLLKKPQQLKADESLKTSPAWKGGAEMLRKSSPNRRTSLVDTVPPLAPRASADIPWKSGVQLLKKTSRESSPTKTDLPDMPQEANVPWKIGVQMLKKTSRDSSPAVPCQSEGQPQLGVPWKSLKLRKTSGSRDVSPEKRDTTNQSLDVIEWKAGKEMLRKGSPTLAETSHVPAVHKGVDKKESAKAFLTQKLATVAKEQEAISEGTSHKSRDKAKPISIRKVVKDEPIPHVELKPTPQKPKADDKEPIQVVLKKTPSQMKTTSGDSRVVLKPIDQDEKLVEKKTEIKSTLKKAEQTETFGRVELKKTPQKPKEIPKADQRVALKPIPQKVEQSKQFEYQTEEFGHEPTDIPDSSKVVFLSSPEELPVELSSTEFLIVKQKPTVTPKPKEGVPKTKPAIPQKPTMVAPESIKPTEETRQKSSVSLERKQDVNKELIPMNQTEQTFEIESENKEEPLKDTTITEQVTLKQLPKSKEAIVTEIVPEIQLKRTPQSPGESKMESSKVELKHITKKDVKPAIPISKKEERKEQQIELEPVAKSTSMEGKPVVPPSEPLRHEPERIPLQTTIAEVKKPVEPMPVDQEPDNIVTPWRTKKTLEPTLAKVEDSTESTAFPSESITIDANLPSPAVEPSAIPGKKTRETVDKAEEVPEVILKRTPQKIKQEEAVQENIQLKRVPDKSKDTEESTISLKPIQRRDEQDKVAEVVLKRTPQKSQPEVVEFVGIQLKKVPERKPKEIPERAEIRLKPVVGRQNEEEQQLPPSEEMEVESIQRDVTPQQTVESITLAKSSLDQVSQVQPTSEKDEGQPAMTTRVPDSAPEAQEAKREVPWRKKIVPAVPPLPEVKEKVRVPKPDETTRICISTTVPEPEKTKDVLTETKITLKQPVTPVPKQESQIVSEVLPEETLKTQEQIDSIGPVPSGSKEIPLIPQPSKSVRRSPREPELVQSPQQVVLRRTPQKPKVEEPEPEVIKLKKIPQREVPNATLESQPNIPTSISRVPQKATEITTDATMIVKPVTPHKEIEPEVVTEILLKPTPEITTPEEIESVEIETVVAEPKESPKLVVVGKSLKRSPQQPEQVPIPQQVVLKRTPQKPKQDEPEPEMIKLKKIPRQEVSSVTLTPDSKSEIRLDKVPIAKTELELSPAFTPTHHTETTETEIQSIPDDVTVEAKIDVSPSWRKPRFPSVPAEQPIEEKPLLSAAEPVSVTVVPEIVPADDQTTSSATARLKRTQRKYIPEVLESVPMQIEQEELKPMAAVLDEPVTTTLTTTTTSVQLKRPDVPAITSQSKTEEQTVSQQIKTDQAVSITTTKISKTSHKTELVQSPSVEEKLRLPKVKASISSTPKCQPPSFTKKLQPLSSRTGKKVRLHCQFQGEPQPTITWYRNESVLLASADRLDITTEPTSSVLEISQVVLEDTGIYTCRAVNEAGSAITSANFIVQAKGEGGEAPRFVLPLSPIRASDGEPTKLICTLTGKPIPQITWYCGQREIRPSRDFQPAFEPSTGTASLTITEVFPDDEGIYRCRATNAHGTVECEAPLTVGDMIVVSHQELVRAPVIAQPLEPDIVETGSRKVMTIRFDGYPTPEVKWYHNGREIQQNENRLVTTFKNESTLVIVRCDADSTGKYEARAMNEGGEARTSASIQLGDVKTTAQQPPKFRKALRPQIVPESEAIVMEVEVESIPECVFSWKQHGALIQSTEAMQISTQNNRSTLFIPESFVENSGIYTVKAENPAGSVASTATLTVERQLLAEEFTPPVIVKELPQMKVMDGEEVHLTCQVSGTPMPRIKWYHNGQPVREHNGVMMSLSPQGEAVLRLAEAFPEDAGVYECKAVNRAGQITTSTTLHVERYEYIPDSESASITAGPSVGTWEDLTGPSGSEDDLLSDKPVTKKVVKTKTDKKFKFQPQPSKDEELVQDSGAAPRFTVALPQQVDVKDGHQARFEVKVESYPRSSVFWYLNGKEIQPSKDFGIDHLEDGTSILTLSEVFPDDAGELMCEAHNDKGVVTSITRLNVTEYKDTPTYRKPEWVTRMEIVRAQMLESQQPPQFTTEIIDARVQEGEEAKFECYYAGNPKPDICWYFNNKLINPNPNIKIRIKDNTTSCTILEVDQDLEGEYMCKATSTCGAHVTKARLHVHELTGEAREIWLAKKNKVIEEKKRKEQEKEDKKKKKEKGAKLTKEEYLKQALQEKEAAKAEEAKKLAAIEEAKQAKIEAELQPKPEVKVNKAKIQKEAMIEESLNKFVENQAIGLKALLEMTERKSLNVTEVVTQDKANEFSPNQAPFKEFLQIETMLKSGITVDQIVTLGSIGNLPTLTAPETQKALVRLVEDQGFKAVVLQEIVREAAKLAPEEPLGMKAVLKAIETKSAAVEDIVVMATHPEEFNLEAPPVPEMATVSTLLNEGISCEEMLTIVKAGELPALNLPENQWALIQIMEKLGQTAIVSQVIVEEPALNLPATINEIPQTVEERLDKFITNQSIGLRALIDIAVQESVNVSEMATLDRVQEFQPGQAPFQEFLNVDTMLKSGVSVDQIVTLGSTGNLPVLTAPESQKALVRIVEDHGSRAITREIIVKEAAKLVPEEVIGLKAVLKAVKTKKADIKDIVEMATRPEEFGLDAQPVPEMASVSTLLHEGISCEEMLTIVKAGELPALQLPETQWPLIQIMDRLGQTAIVSQIIVEEPTLGLKIEMPETATSIESTVEPLSTAVVEVLPDVRAEPSHEFVTKIKDLEIKERQPAVFTAEVSDDAAQVTWHKDGEPLDQSNTERYEFIAEARKRSLIIRSVSLLDEGEYTCSLADQECTAELVVIELPPEITLRLQDVTVRRGEEASFEIELTKGDAKIQWFRNNEEIQLSEHIQLAIDGKRQRLVIYDSGPEDACEYSCVIGDQKSAARLEVLAPKVNFVAKLPEIVAAPMGQDVTFTVQLTGEDADVTWMKNGEVIVDSDRIKLTRDGCARSLTITKAAIEDSAEYTCILEAMKTVTVLTVEVPKVPPSIPIDQVHTEVWVRRGEDAVIEVPFNGFPTPKAEWTFKGKAIRKTKKSVYTISETSAQLTLKLVDENEAGVYTCKLSNECGDVSVSVTIKLIEKPSSPSAPECLETADDSITIMWKPPGFNGGAVITNYIIEYQEKQTKKWVTANKDVTVVETTYMVTKLTHNTEYRFRVTAVNSAGPGTPSSESLLFKAAKAAVPEAPVIREPLKDVTAGLKETATLSCIIVGVPQPTLTWYKDDDEFVPKSSSYESGLARLILNNTTEESAGQYTCRASNDSGSVECSCTLIIQEAPKIVPEKKTKVYRLQVEKQWSITAKVTGLPRPEITWTKNGASFEGNTHYIADVETQSSTACSTTLTIINTERTDTAKYTLTATNVAGTVTHDITLKISDKPSKPQGPLVAKEVDKTSATMEWKPPLDDGGIELKGYIVEYSEIFTEQWKQVEELCPHPICHVQNLTEGLEYVFRVSAVNDVGTSEPLDTGAPVLIKSQFDTPSAPRGPLDISGMTDTSLVLKWLPPTSDGGSPLTEYLIERREVSKKAWQKVGAVDGKTTYIEACSLKKGTSYNFRITAQNQLGYGPAYSPEDVIVAGKRITPPSPPSNLQVADITSRSVTLQWAPPASTGGAELTGYIIEKMLQGTDKWEKVVTLDPSVTVHCIQNLKERSEFFFRVFTENPMGLSAPAETDKVSLKTHATVPSPPTSPLEVRPVGPNSIIVEWGIPESDGGAAIDGYIVAVRDSRKTMWMEVGQVGADTTRLIVKDMQEGHKYYVRVFARNEVGLSDPLETEEPVKVVRPPDYLEPGIAGPAHKDPTASLSLSTETLSSWMRDANMDADIRIYSRSSLLRRDEYFFRVWYYSRQLFK